MKIGVLSDTHDNLPNLMIALNTYRERGIETVIHCGDLTSLDMVSHFEGFRVIYTTGNMDITDGAIIKRFTGMRADNFAGPVFRGDLGGVLVAATHSHLEGKVMELVREKRFEWLFHGHTHEKRDEVIHGVRIINAGALGGIVKGARSFCVVDLGVGHVEFLPV